MEENFKKNLDIIYEIITNFNQGKYATEDLFVKEVTAAILASVVIIEEGKKEQTKID